jgi:hypothetical protein
MVKFYDPSQNDPSLKIMRGIQEMVYMEQKRLDDGLVEASIMRWLEGKEYKGMVDKYFSKGVKVPDMILSHDCKGKINDFKG